MKKNGKKPDMNSSQESNRFSELNGVYFKLFKKASDIIMVASGDFSVLFPKSTNDVISNAASVYNSEKVSGDKIKGNWNIISQNKKRA